MAVADDRGVLAWEEPRGRQFAQPPPIDHELAAGTLRQYPQEWGIIALMDAAYLGFLRQAASSIRRGMPTVYRPSGTFEATAEIRYDKACLYVRYVGGGN